MSSFTSRINDLTTTHRLSDAAKSATLKFIADILPFPNKCPSLYDLKDKQLPYTKYAVEDGDVFVLNIADQIGNILIKHPMSHTLKKCSHDGNCYCDLSDGSIFPRIQNNTYYLLMNTDGFSPILSRHLQVWPIIFSIINLPLCERRKSSNLILAGMYRVLN